MTETRQGAPPDIKSEPADTDLDNGSETDRTGLRTAAGLAVFAAVTAAVWVFAGRAWVVIIAVTMIVLFVHELGHFVTARWAGMKVTEFFIGFGPRLWSFQRGETRYGVKALWAGAYVRIVGMTSTEKVAAADEDRCFRAKSYPKRMIVVTAGPAMHFVVALVVMFAAFSVDGSAGSDRSADRAERADWTLSRVSPDSPASRAGLLPGDRLAFFDGAAPGTFDEFALRVSQLKNTPAEVVFERAGRQHTATAAVGERLTAEGAAGIAGVIAGDRILAVQGLDGTAAPTYSHLMSVVRLGERTDMTVMDARTGDVVVVHDAVVVATVDAAIASRGFLGVSPEYPTRGLAPPLAAAAAVTGVARVAKDVTLALPSLVTDGLGGAVEDLFGTPSAGTDPASAAELSTRFDSDVAAAAGPAALFEARRLAAAPPAENRVLSVIGAGRLGAELAAVSPADALLLIAVVNVFLGLFNLLPLPPLDGGHAATATYERLRRYRDRSYRVDASSLAPVAYMVVMLLVLIGGIALVRDIFDPLSIG